MRVLKATSKTQGHKSTDFCWTTEGEILRQGFVCCDSERCGCDRSLVGVESNKSTTTFLVDEAPMTEEELWRAISDSYVAAGFGADDESIEDSIAMHRMAEVLPLGAVCDLTGQVLSIRA